MTNAQAQGYAVIALSKLICSGHIKGNKKNLCELLDREMYSLMDIMSEEEAEEKAGRILQGINDTNSRGNTEDIIRVTPEEANKIIDSRERKGLFYCIENGIYVGVDNRDGNAWTEDFGSLSACKRWLRKR
ncbi:hypothetical protein [Ruminiclostridium josui]|uniref:hypothetical protein n=1 Tax=Ruminiclostridium josui TaxID=1499 RepID=UPI0004674B3D|nr:hypothetical protein [Ruminiclostridium josui]